MLGNFLKRNKEVENSTAKHQTMFSLIPTSRMEYALPFKSYKILRVWEGINEKTNEWWTGVFLKMDVWGVYGGKSTEYLIRETYGLTQPLTCRAKTTEFGYEHKRFELEDAFVERIASMKSEGYHKINSIGNDKAVAQVD